MDFYLTLVELLFRSSRYAVLPHKCEQFSLFYLSQILNNFLLHILNTYNLRLTPLFDINVLHPHPIMIALSVPICLSTIKFILSISCFKSFPQKNKSNNLF